MKYIFGILLVFCGEVGAQESIMSRVDVDLAASNSKMVNNDIVSRACMAVASAAIYAHANNQLDSVLNESAKVKKFGSSDNVFFNNLAIKFRLEQKSGFLFPALFHSYLGIKFLEELSGPYKPELLVMYTGYLSASCATVSRVASVP